MAKIYRTTDKIPVKMGGLVVMISPLTRVQKSEVYAILADGKHYEATCKAVQYSVKGMNDLDDYVLEFEGSELSERCVDDLMNAEFNGELQALCIQLLNGIPTEAIEGVKPVKSGGKASRKKK